MSLLASRSCALIVGIAFLLVMATVMLGGDACCERSELNGAYDGLEVLRRLLFEFRKVCLKIP